MQVCHFRPAKTVSIFGQKVLVSFQGFNGRPVNSYNTQKYFHGFLSHETGMIRFVSFYCAKRDTFAEEASAGEAVCLRNVIVK